MHRLGLVEDETEEFARLLQKYPRIKIASMFSHLATADCPDLNEYTAAQLCDFKRMADKIEQLAGYGIKRHILNTAAILTHGKRCCDDYVRLGIGLYGISPLPGQYDLKPVAKLLTRVIAVRRYPAGQSIGYGCKGKLNKPTVIATLPIGYADGIDRRFGNGNAKFRISGVDCPTVGNICMDLCMVDVTQVPDCKGAQVQIFGSDMPIENLARAADTIPYEVLSRISPRVKRIYYKE